MLVSCCMIFEHLGAADLHILGILRLQNRIHLSQRLQVQASLVTNSLYPSVVFPSCVTPHNHDQRSTKRMQGRVESNNNSGGEAGHPVLASHFGI